MNVTMFSASAPATLGLATALAAALTPAPVLAQANTGPNTGPAVKTFTIGMSAPAMCVLGAVSDEDGEFRMNVLTDTATGLLRKDLVAPTKRLSGSFCNAPSELTLEAVEMTPPSAGGTPRPGFARAVHFTASASGWTDQPAVFRTNGPLVQSEATQFQPKPREGDIIIAVRDFVMNGGAGQRPVASRRYEGAVILTIGPRP